MPGKSIVILGGGVGGIVAANVLAKELGREHRVVLVDRKAVHEFAPSYLWVLMGWREPHRVTKGLGLLSRKGVEYINGEVLRIDPANRLVKTSVTDLSYDYLILALGAELAPDTIPGYLEAAHHMYTLEAAVELRDALRSFTGGTLAIGVSSLPFKCPAAPYEAALLLDYHFRKIGIRNKVNLQFFTPEPQPMPVAGPVVGGMIRQMLEGRGISYHPNIKITSVDGEKKALIFDNGEVMGFDLLIAVPPHKGPRAIAESSLVDGAGWVAVDRGTLRTKYDDVYAIGDAAAIKLPSGMMLPKAGVFAHGQAEVVARNIAAEVKGHGERKAWGGKGYCFIETGFGRAGFAGGDFYAEPKPVVKPRKPGRIWHWGKVILEKYWFSRFF